MPRIDSTRTGDAELAAIAAGSQDAFARWMATAEPGLRRAMLSFAAEVDVESVLQETLFRAWRLAGRIIQHGAGDTLLRWSIRTARNLAIDEARRLSGRRSEHADGDVEPEPETVELPDPFLRDILEHCRRSLPRQPGRALGARLEGAGVTDDLTLAQTVGMKLNTFQQNVARARKLLLDCLEGRGVELATLGVAGLRKEGRR